MTATISTPFGEFEVIDRRYPGHDGVARLVPVGGSFKINGKTYAGSIIVNRHIHHPEALYISTNLSDVALTPSATAKLRDAFAGQVAEMLPPLTHDETVAQVAFAVASRTRSDMDWVLGEIVRNESQRVNNLTADERATIKAAQVEAVRAWLDEQS